jgi:hypothetical protein
MDMGAGTSPILGTQLIRDIASSEGATAQLLRVLNHDIRPSQLFRPRRIGKAVARAARDQPGQIPMMMKEVALELRNQVRRSRQHRDPPVGAIKASGSDRRAPVDATAVDELAKIA